MVIVLFVTFVACILSWLFFLRSLKINNYEGTLDGVIEGISGVRAAKTWFIISAIFTALFVLVLFYDGCNPFYVSPPL